MKCDLHIHYLYIYIYLYSLKTWHEYYKQCYTNNLHTMMSFFFLFLKEDFIRKSTKHNTKKLQVFTKYIQTHHHKDFKHCTS